MAIDRNERAARNQSLFREVNERVVALEQGGLQEVAGDGSAVRAICECANAGCHEPIALDIEGYTAIRSSPLRFLIKPGHEWSDVERVVSEHAGYIVVEKVGDSGAIARDLATRGPEEDVAYPLRFDGGWREEHLETLHILERSLNERVEAGDTSARLPHQVVVAFIAELEEPQAAASDRSSPALAARAR
jgi:hypothetical protein